MEIVTRAIQLAPRTCIRETRATAESSNFFEQCRLRHWSGSWTAQAAASSSPLRSGHYPLRFHLQHHPFSQTTGRARNFVGRYFQIDRCPSIAGPFSQTTGRMIVTLSAGTSKPNIALKRWPLHRKLLGHLISTSLVGTSKSNIAPPSLAL
ncbi:hypothetical protein PGT21_019156 [Puccinia graminis f. sp. tritici]|uniref:Uncharacterized protein n=1 Tax=Puccinia graminis f. sp. tritici TaxID=56615 RepID=A0A5B0LNT5_PUCGR|nr:hypothetical protein PGT21_019156 [Puccinia graminis f. sp. tritici]